MDRNFYLKEKYSFLLSESFLLNETPSKEKIEFFLKQYMNMGFRDTLFAFLKQKKTGEVEFYKKAGIDRRLFSKIRSTKSYKPSKKTAIVCSIALQLDYYETTALLASAGYKLSSSQVSDAIITYFINIKNYNISELNEVLCLFTGKTL